MIPSTLITLGAKQQNIGLDKENFTGALSYNWTPTETQLPDLICSTQFVQPSRKITLMYTVLVIMR
jgi:hypothetical protein